MKKYFVTLLSVILLLISSSVAFAAPAPKTVTTDLVASALKVKVGETVNLTATTLKSGSTFSDEWTGVTKSTESTELNDLGYYISTANFSSNSPGYYTISYAISMTAGKSPVVFNGSNQITIEVYNPAIPTGAVFIDKGTLPTYNSHGVLNGYDIVGKIYIVWSDGTQTLYGDYGTSTKPHHTGGGGKPVENIQYTWDNVLYSFVCPINYTK